MPGGTARGFPASFKAGAPADRQVSPIYPRGLIGHASAAGLGSPALRQARMPAATGADEE